MRGVMFAVLIAALPVVSMAEPVFNIGNAVSAGSHMGEKTQMTGAISETFDKGSNCAINNSSVFSFAAGSNYVMGKGTVHWQRLEPDATSASPTGGDDSCYVAVPKDNLNASATVSITIPNGDYVSYLAFEWGSCDPYNTVEFLDAGGNPITTNLGSTIDGQSVTNLRDAFDPFASFLVEATWAASDTPVKQILFHSTNYAFEFDNLAVAFTPIPQAPSAQPSAIGGHLFVPEPSALALGGLGAGGLALARRRRH